MKLVHTPKKEKKKMYLFSVCVFSVIAVLFSLAAVPVINAGIWQFLALILFVFSTLILSKFYLSEYTYVITDNEFLIYKRTGEKSVKVCHIDNFSIVALYSLKEWKSEKKNRQITGVYNYNASIRPARYYALVFDLGSRKSAVLFEPSDEIRDAVFQLIHDRTESQ